MIDFSLTNFFLQFVENEEAVMILSNEKNVMTLRNRKILMTLKNEKQRIIKKKWMHEKESLKKEEFKGRIGHTIIMKLGMTMSSE